MTAQEAFEAILEARGITDVDAFLNSDYDSLSDPYLMADMKLAVNRILKAAKQSEKVAIYGDYDVDGMTATTILVEYLTKAGLEVVSFIPDRFIDGYGLSKRGIDELAGKGVKLLITVDTGSLSHDQIKYAQDKHHIDVIVTDHHTLGDDLPPAVAVLNPKRKDSKYPFRDFAGVGVAYTLLRALQQTDLAIPAGHEKWLLDLVALGTVCDVVPLKGENRILVKWGLHVMRQNRRPGLSALLKVSATEPDNITTTSLGFRLGPRLNASGRLTHASTSLELLATTNPADATKTAIELDNLNSERRQKQKYIIDMALTMIDSKTEENVHIFVHPEFHHGIVGIVASKLVEKLGTPVFVLQQEGDVIKGSARAPVGYDLAAAVSDVAQFIDKGGGHAAAAGVTLKQRNLESFKKALKASFSKQKSQRSNSNNEQFHDLELDNLEPFSLELLDLLEKLEPFGTDHEVPQFKLSKVSLADWRPVGSDKSHAKMTISDSSGKAIDGIGFGLAYKMPSIGSIVSLTTAIEANTFRGDTKPQLMVRNIEKETG